MSDLSSAVRLVQGRSNQGARRNIHFKITVTFLEIHPLIVNSKFKMLCHLFSKVHFHD